MKSEKIIAAAVIGAVAALILVPKTRRMLTDALNRAGDSLKNIADDASDMAEKGSNQLSKFADTAKDVVGSVRETKQAW